MVRIIADAAETSAPAKRPASARKALSRPARPPLPAETAPAPHSVGSAGTLLSGVLARFPGAAGRVDAVGTVTAVEGAGLRRFALAPGDLLGVSLPSAFPGLSDALAPALAGGAAEFHWEGTIQGELCHLEVSFFFDAERGGGACFLVRDLTESKRLEHEVLSITEEGQQRLGADLHDGLGQHLTGLACLTSALADRLRDAGSPEHARAAEIAILASDAISQTRAIARGLSPVQLEHYGLQSALESLAYEVHQRHGVECRFRGGAASPVYDHAAAVHLYRIAQEAVNNALKHASPRRIDIRLAIDGARGLLCVEDDGRGLPPSDRKAEGIGLRLMGYRASLIGATLEIGARPPQGTRVRCRFPNPATP